MIAVTCAAFSSPASAGRTGCTAGASRRLFARRGRPGRLCRDVDARTGSAYHLDARLRVGVLCGDCTFSHALGASATGCFDPALSHKVAKGGYKYASACRVATGSMQWQHIVLADCHGSRCHRTADAWTAAGPIGWQQPRSADGCACESEVGSCCKKACAGLVPAPVNQHPSLRVRVSTRARHHDGPSSAHVCAPSDSVLLAWTRHSTHRWRSTREGTRAHPLPSSSCLPT